MQMKRFVLYILFAILIACLVITLFATEGKISKSFRLYLAEDPCGESNARVTTFATEPAQKNDINSNQISQNVESSPLPSSSSQSKTTRNSPRQPSAAASSTTYQVPPLFHAEYERIASTNQSARCERYGFNYTASITPRRLFFGAMVADDSREVFEMHATEAHGLYHVIALSESNTTHMNTPRKLRFSPGSDDYKHLTSGIFGPDTTILVDYWLSHGDNQKNMERESLQRTTILEIWKRAGMGWRDVGIMGDIDEVFSRDFLLAATHCDIPTFREGQDCRTPRITPFALSFESSPHCIKRMFWHHPDMVVGECLEGIGDPSGRVVPVRRHKRLYGRRADGYGEAGTADYNEQIVASGRYPLFNGVDMRDTRDTSDGRVNWKIREGRSLNRAYGVAYHFHNWFSDFKVLRNKYRTYAHGDRNVYTKTLSDMELDLDVMVRCVRGLPQSVNPEGRKRFEMPYDRTTGPKPIFFLNETYRQQRHELVQQQVIEDEAKYGSKYQSIGS